MEIRTEDGSRGRHRNTCGALPVLQLLVAEGVEDVHDVPRQEGEDPQSDKHGTFSLEHTEHPFCDCFQIIKKTKLLILFISDSQHVPLMKDE